MSNKHWQSSPNDDLLLSIFPEEYESDDGGGFWGNLGRLAGSFVTGLAKRAGEVLSELDLNDNNSFYNQSDYSNFNWNQADNFYDANLMSSDWQGSPVIQGTDSQAKNQFYQSKITRSPSEQVKIGERLEAIDSVIENNPELRQAFSDKNRVDQNLIANAPGIYSTTNPSVTDVNFQQNNPALNAQNGSEIDYPAFTQSYGAANPQVEFGIDATMDGLSSYHPSASASALPKLEQMKRARQEDFSNYAQTTERARQQYQERGQQNTVPVIPRFGFVDDWGKNGLKYKLSPERKEKLRQEIEAERNNPLNKKSLPKAFYESRYEGKVDLWKKLESGKVLDKKEAKQLFHSNNLFRLKDKNNAENQHIANTADMVATNQMIKNMVANTSQDDDGKYLINGQPIEKKTIEKLALENVKHLQKHDEFMSFTQLNKRARDLQAIQDAAAENEFISASQSAEDSSKLALGGNHDADMNANTAYDFLGNPYQSTLSIKKKELIRDIQKTQHKLIFDGKSLKDYQYSGTDLVRVVSYPGTSGAKGSRDPKIKNNGPIPEGKYYLDTRDISYKSWRALTNIWYGDWGLYRVPLKPHPETNTFGRDEFFIHGGEKPGSAGCIDIGKNDAILLRGLSDTFDIIEIEVSY